MMNITKKIKHTIKLIKNTRKINKRLKGKIKECGIEDSEPFIKLEDGMKFFGYKSEKYQKKFVFLFNNYIRSKINEHYDCINLLYDIRFRYLVPPNLKETYDLGKFYDISQGDVILEIGAYTGIYAIKMSKLVGDTGKVIAVEAINKNYKILQKNIEINNISNLIALKKAVWNKKGTLKFYSNKMQDNSAIKGIVNTKNTIEVECDTIDSIVKNQNIKKVDFIRIQVNGAENEVIDGMDETIKYKPKLMVTAAYTDKEKIARKLSSKGYNTEIYKYAVFAYV